MQRYTVVVCGSSANFLQKPFHKILRYVYARSYVCTESEKYSLWVLYLGIKKNDQYQYYCLIIPNRQFNALSENNLTLRITLPRNGAVTTLQTAIQSQLGHPYNNIPLDICQVYYPGSVDERRMQPQALISAYFEGDPPADLIHVVASPIPPPSY